MARMGMATWLWLGMACGWGAAATLFAADDPAPPPSRPPLVLPPLQPGDEAVLPLDPARPRTPDDARRMEALAHFMAGELYLERGGEEGVAKGLRELEQSIELYPKAIEPYRLYLPAVVQAREEDRAQRYALLALENTAEGVQLVRALVAVYVQQGRLAPAIAVLQAAVQLDALPPRSFGRLILTRHLGQCLALNNDPARAAEVYQRLLAELRPQPPELSEIERKQLFGERGELYEDMGNAFLAAKLPELAVEAFDESARLRGGSPGVHSYNLALVFRQTGKPERALEELDKYFAAQLIEKGRAPYQLLKELLTELGRAEELLPRLRTLAASDAHNKFLHHFLASELVAQGDLDEAEKIYRQRGGETDPEALVGLASIYRRQGKYVEWLKSAGRAFAILQLGNPRVRERLSAEYQDLGQRFEQDCQDLAAQAAQLDAVLALGREWSSGDTPKLDFEQAWLLGRIAVQAERTDDAARFYKYAIGMQNLPSYDLFRELGAHYIDQKRYRDAERTFQEAADHPALDPYRSFFLYLVSIAREMDGRIDAAIEAILAARQLAPDQSQFALQQARIYYRARRWDDAIAVFESIIRDFHDDAELVRDCRFSLSAIHVQKGDFDAGEQILLEILEQDPEHPQANNDLGYLWADRGKNLERAKEMIAKALAAEPENAAYLDSMGWVLYRLEKYPEAVEHLQRAAALPRGEDPTILDHLGDALHQVGQTDKAVEAWRKALQLEEEKPFPDPELVESLRKKLPAAPPATEPAPRKE
jgi:tetratricopeptide (TPR) repeat protein